MKARRRWIEPLQLGLLGLLALSVLPFVLHSVDLAGRGMAGALAEPSHLFPPAGGAASAAIALHMVTGAAITLLAPLQLVGPIRRRWPALHRWSGRVLAVAAAAAALAGLFYIAARGTVGGPMMDLAFATYGGLMLLAAVQTARHARARRFELHRDWALRLFVLAIGSWIYRVHYGLWYMATGGIASNDQFTGLFDRVQLWAFFLPYLVLVELWLRARRRREGAAAGGGAVTRPS